MAVKLSTAARNELAQTLINKIDEGTTNPNGKIVIYDGTKPSSPDEAVSTQNVLSEHDLSSPCGTVSNGVLTFNTIQEDSAANNTGTATWARFFNKDGEAVADATITEVGGGGDLQMNTVNVVAGGPVRFTSLTWTMPGA